MIYKPVCGKDGKTYGNSCSAKCKDVEYTDGRCEDAAPVKNIDWKLMMSASEQKQEVKAGTTVVFQWMGTHNVFIFPDEAAYKACDFSNADRLSTTSGFKYVASNAGTFYFGCEVGSHCAMNQKLSLNVVGAWCCCEVVFRLVPPSALYCFVFRFKRQHDCCV